MKSLKKKKTEEVKEVKKAAPIHIDAKTHEIKEDKEPVVEVIPEVDVKVEEKSSFFIQMGIPVIIGVIAGVVTGTVVFSLLNIKSQKSTTNASPTPTAQVISQEQESTQSGKMSEVDLTLYDIKVLNGSGKGGEAGKLEKTLKEKGFSVLEIGNADNSDYEKTKIQVKKKVSKDYLTKLIAVLEELFDVEDRENLDEDEDVDVIITVGRNSKLTPSATPTPEEE